MTEKEESFKLEFLNANCEGISEGVKLIIEGVNNELNYNKAGNYWRWLKRKLLKADVQFVSGTHRLKLTAADGKKYLID